jgi:hypothetical protein
MKIETEMIGALGTRVRLDQVRSQLRFEHSDGDRVWMRVDADLLGQLAAILLPPTPSAQRFGLTGGYPDVNPTAWPSSYPVSEQRRRDWNQVAWTIRFLGGRNEKPANPEWFEALRKLFLELQPPPAIFLMAWACWLQQRASEHAIDQDLAYFRSILESQTAYTRVYLELNREERE